MFMFALELPRKQSFRLVNTTMVPNVQTIEIRYPCRKDFIRNLSQLISDPEEIFPPAVYVYGHAGTGKTAIIKEFLALNKQLKSYHGVYVNCVECYSTKILLKNILEELIGTDERCDTLNDFAVILRSFDTKRTNGYMVAIDSADRLRDMDNNLLPSLLRLQDLTGLNICVVLLSQMPIEKYHCKTGLSELIILHCPQYTKADTLKILSGHFENVMEILKRHVKERYADDHQALDKQYAIVGQVTPDFFNNYLNVFLSVFYKACRDVPELKITASKCFLPYMEPVLNGSLEISDVTRLWRNIAAPLRSALSRVYMRFESGENPQNEMEQAEETFLDQSVKKMALSFELPFYGKYLLIAAFLASYNSAKDDKRLFVKHHGKQRKRMQTVNAKAKVTEKMTSSLGPKSFSLDRLLAIFYAILDEKVGLTCNLLSQISTLVHLKLLGFVSGENNMMDGSARLQCTISLEFVLYIGKVVGFNVYQYLCDFM